VRLTFLRQACQSVPASQLRWRSRSADESLGEGGPGHRDSPGPLP
jgi:hypothetical protein